MTFAVEALLGPCDYEDCPGAADVRVGDVRFCVDHIEWGMRRGLAGVDHVRRALVRELTAIADDPTTADLWRRRGNLVRYQLHTAATGLRAAERLTASMDARYSQSLAAVALQAEDLLEQLPRRMGRSES